jgi:hypothetical protein
MTGLTFLQVRFLKFAMIKDGASLTADSAIEEYVEFRRHT